jgi:hypothetical protein
LRRIVAVATRVLKDVSMHQSPQKQVPLRRDRHAAYDLLETDAMAERRMFRAAQPKARKHARDDDGHEREDFREHRRERS